MVMPMTRGWLKLHGYMTVVCAIVTLVLGLLVWFDTLTSRARLGEMWNTLPSSTQSLVQQEVSSTFEILGSLITKYRNLLMTTNSLNAVVT